MYGGISHSPVSTFAKRALAALAIVIATSNARAQFVVLDPANLARSVLHYARRLEQFDLQKKQYEQQIAAMRKLPNPPWRSISQTVSQLQSLMADGRALGYQLANLEAQFRATFPVTRSFRDWPTERRDQAQRTVATMETAINGAREQAHSFDEALGRIAEIKSRVGSIEGHEGALELQNTATVFGDEELVLLRQALMAQTSMQGVYYADRVNTEAQQATTIDERLTGLSAPARRGNSVSLRPDRPQ
jgi:P-type conjugative transfer protein TrbJ